MSGFATLEVNSDTHRQLYRSQLDVTETGKGAVSLVRPPSNREVVVRCVAERQCVRVSERVLGGWRG